jgi:uncharacterized protein YuzE
MKVRYDPDVDALYLHLTENDVDRTDEVAPGVIVDYDADGETAGVEILWAAKHFVGIPWIEVAEPVAA